jgi:ketosteroid isomerase-like protein
MGDGDEGLDGADEELRQVVLERVAAVRAKDAKPLAARQAPDVITFDSLPPLTSGAVARWHNARRVVRLVRRGHRLRGTRSARHRWR